MGLLWRGGARAELREPSRSCPSSARAVRASAGTWDGLRLMLPLLAIDTWHGERRLALASHSLLNPSSAVLSCPQPVQEGQAVQLQMWDTSAAFTARGVLSCSSCTPHSPAPGATGSCAARKPLLITKGINKCREGNFNDISVPRLSGYATTIYPSSQLS